VTIESFFLALIRTSADTNVLPLFLLMLWFPRLIFLLTNSIYFLYRLKQALITHRLNLSPEEALDFVRKLKVNIHEKSNMIKRREQP